MLLSCPCTRVAEEAPQCQLQAKHCLCLHRDSLRTQEACLPLHKFLLVQASSCKSKPHSCRLQNSPHPCNSLNALSCANKTHFFCQHSWLLSWAAASVATATLYQHTLYLLPSFLHFLLYTQKSKIQGKKQRQRKNRYQKEPMCLAS